MINCKKWICILIGYTPKSNLLDALQIDYNFEIDDRKKITSIDKTLVKVTFTTLAPI